jgi:hypothetical protein
VHPLTYEWLVQANFVEFLFYDVGTLGWSAELVERQHQNLMYAALRISDSLHKKSCRTMNAPLHVLRTF